MFYVHNNIIGSCDKNIIGSCDKKSIASCFSRNNILFYHAMKEPKNVFIYAIWSERI